MKDNLDEQIRIVKKDKDSLTVSRLAFDSHYKKHGYKELADDDVVAVITGDEATGNESDKARELISGKPVKTVKAEKDVK